MHTNEVTVLTRKPVTVTVTVTPR